jgi:hypothetical protein
VRGCGIVGNVFVGVPKFEELGHCHDGIPVVNFGCALFLHGANTMIRATVLLLNFKFSKPTTDVVSALVLDFYGQVFNSVNVTAVICPT